MVAKGDEIEEIGITSSANKNGGTSAASVRLLTDDNRVKIIDDEITDENIEQEAPEEERGQWTGQFDFLMSMIAYCVGLGNVWRFPYLCFKNGGGTFLLVYALFWCIGAVPIFLMEVTIGQHLQKGGIEVWNIVPIMKGVGIGNVVIAFMCIWYYCVIITWAFYYIYSSFAITFPWETCMNWWNTDTCTSNNMNKSVLFQLEARLNLTNQSGQTSVEQFWENRVLQQTDSIDDTGAIVWELLVIKMIVWIIIYFALWKGITEARKFVYFCALAPYVMLFILLFRGITLPGAMNGIKYFLIPDLSKLYDPTVWKDAGTQVFYSYGVGFGTLIALGSHNKYNHNCKRDALILCTINASTSMLAGFVVFSILGYMAGIADKSVEEIVKPGVGLAFLAYPEVAASLPLKQVWACLFFIMLSILGIDSQVCMVEGATTALEDTFPLFRKHKKRFLAAICVIFFILGIPMVTQAGNYWLTLIDSYGPSGIALLFIVFFEIVGLSWGFGAERVAAAMEDMIGERPNRVWIWLWKFGSPFACIVLFIFLVIKHEPLRYADHTPYPMWSLILGGCIMASSMLCIPGYAIYYLIVTPGDNLRDKIRKGFTSTVALPYKQGREMKAIRKQTVDMTVTEAT